MRIIGFYHILMSNHFLQIVNEQVSLIVASGLYNNCENIHIGALGSAEDLEEVKKVIKPYKKFLISYHSPQIEEYEFPTLNLLKNMSDTEPNPFTAFYIHTKGASFSVDHAKGYNGGNYWRGSMNYYNITNWRSAASHIQDLGFETAGTKIRGSWLAKDSVHWKKYHQTYLDRGEWRFEYPLHYSGNFFWCSSEYIKRLPSINSLDQSNRFNAEFWVCSAQPKCESLNQDWVDYNSKGIWENPSNMIQRNIVHTLCWNVYSEVEMAVDDLYARNDAKDFIHVLVDLGFPLEEGNVIPEDVEEAKERNTDKLKALAEKYGSIYLKADNIGVSQNWTTVSKFMNVNENDVLICCDPDERVKNDGWVLALAGAIRSDVKYGWMSLIMEAHLPVLNKKNVTEFTNSGYRVWEIDGLVNWAQGALSGKLIVRMGGEIPFMPSHPVYGHLEAAVMRKMTDYNYKWGMLPDYFVEHTDDVPLLRAWKDQIIFNIKGHGQLSLEAFLQLKKTGQL